jgi:hypothetical protein
VQIRYLTKIHGQHYFQRRYPVKLQPLLKAKGLGSIYKRQLSVDVNASASALAAAVEQENEKFQLYVDTLLNANADNLTDLELDKRAEEWLRQHDLKGGEIFRAEVDNTAGEKGSHYRDYILDTVFEDISHGEACASESYREEHPELAVQYRAWRMVTEPPRSNTPALLFSDCWKGYALERALAKDETEKRLIRSRQKELRRWEDFLLHVGEQELTQENVIRALADWKRHLDARPESKKLQPSSIQRMLGIPVAVFNRAAEDYGLNLVVKKPKIKDRNQAERRRHTFDRKEQVELLELVQNESHKLYKQWIELYVLLSLQTATFASELQRMPISNIRLDDPIPHIKFDGRLKTNTRPRTVPLVLCVNRIRMLLAQLNDGSGKAMGSYISNLDESAVSHALKGRCKLVNASSTAYSLRHAFAHNCDVVGVNAKDKATLGGWAGGDNVIMNGYGSGARESDEMMERLQKVNKEICKHLIEIAPVPQNVTSISAAKTRQR